MPSARQMEQEMGREGQRGRGSRAEGVGQHGQITGYVSGSDLTAHAGLHVFARQGGRDRGGK